MKFSSDSIIILDTGYHEVLKGVLMKNIHHFGSIYARYMKTGSNDKMKKIESTDHS